MCFANVVGDALEGESLEKWTSCVGRVEELGLESPEAETVVGQAFGWGKQSYWLNKKKDQVPDLEQVTPILIENKGPGSCRVQA